MTASAGYPRLPRRLVAEVRAAMIERPGVFRTRMIDRYRGQHHHPMAWALVEGGMDHARAFSRADEDVRRDADREVPALDRFAAGDADLVELFGRMELAEVRRHLCWTVSSRRWALGRFRSWGILRTTIKEADRRHRERARSRTEGALEREQRRIITTEVPRWEWLHEDRIAPGVHGYVETNTNGAIHVWTLVADRPLSGAGGRFLDGLPRDRRVRVFGVGRGSLCEAMLTRRGFSRSRYAWHGLRAGESVAASAWTWMYR